MNGTTFFKTSDFKGLSQYPEDVQAGIISYLDSLNEESLYSDDMNIKKFGSQGQQRMAVLAIKLSEIEIFKNYLGTSPILLLDDVFSELDSIKRNNLLKYVNSSIQTIITTTDLDSIDSEVVNGAKLFNIKNGKVERC